MAVDNLYNIRQAFAPYASTARPYEPTHWHTSETLIAPTRVLEGAHVLGYRKDHNGPNLKNASKYLFLAIDIRYPC